jgi:hypothetical protein
MRPYLKTLGITAVAALSLAITSIASSDSANARPFGGMHHGGFHHGFHGGHFGHRGFGVGPRFGGALALGAVATAPYWYHRPVALYDDCVVRRRIVGYTYWGRPIVRVKRICY